MLIANICALENSFEFSDPEKGCLFVVSNINIFEKIKSLYYSNFSPKPFEVLKQSVEASLGENVVAVSYYNGCLYFSVFGEGSIFLHRSGESKELVNNNSGLKSGSGFPKEDDILTLKTPTGKLVIKFENKKKISFNIPVLFNKKIYLKPQTDSGVSTESKRFTLFLGILLLLFLSVGIFIGLNKKRNDDLKQKYSQILSSATDNLEKAISFSSSDAEKSREYFAISVGDIQKLEDLKIDESVYKDIKNKIENTKEVILGEYKTDVDQYLDLSLLSSGFNGSEMSLSGGNLYILDTQGKKVVKIETSTKKSKVVAGPSVLENPNKITSYEDTLYLLENGSIYKIDNKKILAIDKSWNDEVFIKVFGGNMYVLDKSLNQIYRYQAGGNSFGEKQNWLSSKTTANFSDAKSWGIDGAVYVLYPNTKILKYSQGSPQSFRISGVIPEIGNIDDIFADANNNYLYLLDRVGKRIVVVNKNGSYKAQYINEKIAQTTKFIASENDRKMILLTGEKLLQIELKHLN